MTRGCACDHDNPVCDCGTDAPTIASELSAFLDSLEAGGIDIDRLRFMPLGDDKKPIIEGRCRLESDEADLYLHTAEEAHTALYHGHPGFAIYFGRDDHGTEDLLAVDNDEPEFPEDEMPDTGLKVMSGSGNFPGHYYYINDGSVDNASPSFGEVRAKNLYAIVPGSTHPTGGIYHAVETDAPAEIGQDDLPEDLHPKSRNYESVDHENIDATPPEELEDATFTNQWGEPLEKFRDADDDLDQLLTHLDPPGYDNDTSRADAAAVSKLHYWGFEPSTIYDIVRRFRAREKAIDRKDYWWDHTIPFATQGEQVPPPPDHQNGTVERDHWDEGNFEPGWMTTIPATDRGEAINSGWDWTHGRNDPLLSHEEVWGRVERVAENVMSWNENCVIDSPMASGKTYSTFKVAADLGDPLTYLTARTDLYDQAIEYCRELGLSYYVLPAVHRHCPTFQGEHGEGWEDDVKDKYRRGATPQEIHENMNLPCGGTDDEDGPQCPYHARTHFDPDNFDVLIGHFAHSNLPQALAGRHVVVDEYPGDAMRTTLAERQLESAINAFCDIHRDFPADDFVDLIEQRGDDEFVEAATGWILGEFDWDDPDARHVFDHDEYHAKAPHAIYTMLNGVPPGDAFPGYGFEKATLPGEGRHQGVFERATGAFEKAVHLQTPPQHFNLASAVIGLDGTPEMSMWETALGLNLDRRQPIASEEERRSFYHDTLGIDVVKTSKNVKPYSSGEYVTVEKDRAVVSGVAETVTEPIVVSSKKAIRQYEDDEFADDGPAKELDNFANLRGSNKYADEECAVIVGSPSYGHDWVRREAAFQNKDVYPEGKGNDLDYGEGERIAEQMNKAVILQTILRFGRSTSSGAVVYLHTNIVPDEIDVAATGHVQKTWTDNQRDIYRAAEAEAEREGTVTVDAVHEHPDVDCTRRTVQRTLRIFWKSGMFHARDEDGRRVVYTEWDTDPHNVTPDGLVSLPGVGQTTINVDSDEPHKVVFMPVFGVDPADPPPLDAAGVHETDDAADGGVDPPPSDSPAG